MDVDSEQTLAAVDLGSNSFHMVIATYHRGELRILDRHKEVIRLASGLRSDGVLDERAQIRALGCLRRFGQRLRGMSPQRVRAVGTNTLRKARDLRTFLDAAAGGLGFPIDVISGQEEARLVYLGVSQSIREVDTRRLVVDIGGGSTECIVGEGSNPILSDSLFMGCVSHSLAFFSDGTVTREKFRRANLAAQLELQPIERRYADLGWGQVVGSSGTINSIANLLQGIGWSDGAITPQSLKRLRRALLDAGHVQRLGLEPLEAARREVLPGGLAILMAVFERFGVQTMEASPGALREGLLYDIVGRLRHEDLREHTIKRSCERFDVDQLQGERVERSAAWLFAQVKEDWGVDTDYAKQMLTWAARLHEIGLALNYTGYHKHGAYLITNAHMPGLSRDDKQFLACLVRFHRRRLSQGAFAELGSKRGEMAKLLCLLLRLAVLFNRARRGEPVPVVEARASDSALVLYMDASWLATHPLTVFDLEQEAAFWRLCGMTLRFADGVSAH